MILVIAAFIQAIFGISGMTLNMTGFAKLNLMNVFICLSLNIGLNILFIPKMGGFGAAILEEASNRKLDSSLITRLALPDRWIGHGSRVEPLREAGIDMEGIARCVSQILEKRPTSKPAIEQPTTSG